MKKISVLVLVVLFALLATTCQWYTKDGAIIYNYKGEYVLEAPVTSPSFTQEEINYRVAKRDDGVWILAAHTKTVWVTGGAIMDYFGINNWTQTPNGKQMDAIGTWGDKTVYGFFISNADIESLLTKVSDNDCIKEYGVPKGCFAFKFKTDGGWTDQFATDEGTPYHLKNSSGPFINCVLDLTKPDATYPYSPN
ncbi:MAG TPA: hypothetical protein PLE45_11805 [Spirochaetota bacterium]|nr:hypothetical protein [Spirochaetota bacterium]